MKYLSQLFLLISVFFVINIYGQNTVYVQTNQFGRGILKMRGNECFVITPEHLLKKGEEDYNGPINVFGEGGVRSRADLFKSYTGDLAILRFDGETNQNCTKWQLAKNYSSVIENIYEGFLELRDKVGSTTKVAVNISGIDVQYITIRPKDFRENFYQGMSGSSLFVEYKDKKVFLGMLQSISDDETGSVIRADEIDKILSSHFKPIKKQKKSNIITDKDLTKEVQGFKFDLLDINKSGDRVTFTFDVTSLESDKMIHLMNNNVVLYEDKGSVLKANTILIGNKTSGYAVEYKLIKNASVTMSIVFTDISSSSKFATMFEIGFSHEKKLNKFEYRDLYFGDESEDISAVIEKKGNWSKEELGFKFDLLDYEKTGTDVIFTFSITSLNKDKTVKLYNGNIFLYDDKGIETKPSNVLLGNRSSGYAVEYKLIQGIPVALVISFKDVASSATGVSKIEVGFSDDQSESNFGIRGLPFTTKTKTKTITTSVGNINSNVGKPATNCSELYFYRKKAFMECPESIYLYNHGELLTKLEAGTRFKSIVCDDRSFKLSAKTNQNEIALSNSKPIIEMGKKYYFKISCAVGVSTIKLQETAKGKKDISSNGKFKRKLGILPLTDY